MTGASAPAHAALAHIQVSANCSLSRRGAVLFFSGVAGGSLSVAILFASVGMWPVLPFAGLELLLLGTALALSMRRGQEGEAITVTGDKVIVERYGRGSRETREFTRLWAKAELRRSPGSWHPSRLVIVSHGRGVEVGGALAESARQDLYRKLAALIGRPGETPDKAPAFREQE